MSTTDSLPQTTEHPLFDNRSPPREDWSDSDSASSGRESVADPVSPPSSPSVLHPNSQVSTDTNNNFSLKRRSAGSRRASVHTDSSRAQSAEEHSRTVAMLLHQQRKTEKELRRVRKELSEANIQVAVDNERVRSAETREQEVEVRRQEAIEEAIEAIEKAEKREQEAKLREERAKEEAREQIEKAEKREREQVEKAMQQAMEAIEKAEKREKEVREGAKEAIDKAEQREREAKEEAKTLRDALIMNSRGISAPSLT